MATEYEELRLTVTLVDNASTGLEKIQKSLQQIGGSEHKQQLEGVTKQSKEFAEAFKGVGEAFGFSAEKLLPMIKNITTLGGAIGAIGFTMHEASKRLNEFVQGTIALDAASKAFGVQSAQIPRSVSATCAAL